MKKILAIFTVAASLLLSGCASNQDLVNHISNDVISLKTKVVEGDVKGDAFASGVRWNDEFIVSVKHLSDGSGLSRCEVNKVDLAFYRKSVVANERVPKWENIRNQSNVSMEGFVNMGNQFTAVPGVVKPFIFTYKGQSKYKLVSGVVAKGMSGGPVKNDNGNIVGLIIGYTANEIELPQVKNQEAEQGKYSVVLPYSVIADGWKEVQEKIASGFCRV